MNNKTKNPQHFAEKFKAIQARRVQLDKKDEQGRPVYTYTHIVSKLSAEFYMSERSIERVLLMDVDKWLEERLSKFKAYKEAQANQQSLF